MDQSEQSKQHQPQQQQHPVMRTVASTGQIPYGATPYATAAMVASGTPAVAVPSPIQLPNQQLLQQIQHFNHQQQQQLQMFRANQMQEIVRTTDFKNHSLPLARIKKIMKADEDVGMISAEAPIIFAKACEMFILELTLMAWLHTEENKRRTLQKNDIAAAISKTEVFDFLVDIIPRDELTEGPGVNNVSVPVAGPFADMPYYYAPSHPMTPPGMIMGIPVDQGHAEYGNQQSQSPVAFVPWTQNQPQQQQPEKQQADS